MGLKEKINNVLDVAKGVGVLITDEAKKRLAVTQERAEAVVGSR